MMRTLSTRLARLEAQTDATQVLATSGLAALLAYAQRHPAEAPCMPDADEAASLTGLLAEARRARPSCSER